MKYIASSHQGMLCQRRHVQPRASRPFVTAAFSRPKNWGGPPPPKPCPAGHLGTHVVINGGRCRSTTIAFLLAEKWYGPPPKAVCRTTRYPRPFGFNGPGLLAISLAWFLAFLDSLAAGAFLFGPARLRGASGLRS